jgi:hypothetical protein
LGFKSSVSAFLLQLIPGKSALDVIFPAPDPSSVQKRDDKEVFCRGSHSVIWQAAPWCGPQPLATATQFHKYLTLKLCFLKPKIDPYSK